MVTEIILPVLGETMNEGTIVEWLKQEGDAVGEREALYSIESDKATLEVESPVKGYLRKIMAPKGAVVPVLSVVAFVTSTPDEALAGAAGTPATTPAQAAGAAAAADLGVGGPNAAATTPAQEPAPAHAGGRIFASPRARKLAADKAVDLAAVTGSGPGGRIVERDVLAYLESAPKVTPVARRLAEQAGLDLRALQATGAGGRISKGDVERAVAAPAAPVAVAAAVAAPVAPAAPAGPAAVASEVPMSGVRAVIARRMHDSSQITAPVTLTTEVDATALVGLREDLKAKLAQALGFNLGYNELLIKVVAYALREFPYMNARLDEAAGVIKQLSEIHVALAVDTERGLLVPVIRNADRKGVAEIGKDIRNLVEKARTGKAAPDELSGSTFTISNLGMHEIDAFTPIINLPEAAILGVGRIKARAVVVDGQIVVRQMLWLSLTHDHRIVDGAPAARFLQRVKGLIEAPYLLLA
jgi:pyruvate dehydrogenase E2 component (dihydrolipoamide acetyltransferase)